MTPGPPQPEGATPPAPTPTRPLAGRGAQAPRCWDPNLGPLNFSAVVASLGVFDHLSLFLRYLYVFRRLSSSLWCLDGPSRPAIAFGCLQFTRKLSTEFRGVNSAMSRECACRGYQHGNSTEYFSSVFVNVCLVNQRGNFAVGALPFRWNNFPRDRNHFRYGMQHVIPCIFP